MTNSVNMQYYVEGEDERKLVNALKTDLQVIVPGKVDVFNVTSKIITNARLITLKPKTIVVLIFDTDVGNNKILNKNIETLQKCKNIISIITVPQNKNLEDELVASCNIRNAIDLLGSQGRKKFKTDFIRISNLSSKLVEKGFNIEKIWLSNGTGEFVGVINQSEKIKLKHK